MQKGDWSRLTDYLRQIKCGGTSKPKKIILNQENLRDITGTIQVAKLYKDHTTQKDINDRAAKAGYSVEQDSDGDFIFT